jgi:secreted PhoX family phosphatase
VELFRKPGRRRAALVGAAALAAIAVPIASAVVFTDFGLGTQSELRSEANDLYGSIGTPLAATAASDPAAGGAASVKLAGGLSVGDVLRGDIATSDLTDQLGQHADMIAFWPTDTNPQWGIVCIEGRPGNAATDPFQGVQRIKLHAPNKGKVETILTGTDACDGIRRTPWNTIFATEETSNGWGIEIYDPLNTTNVVFDRQTGLSSGGTHPGNVVSRLATGLFAWEGLYIRDNGVMYAGDELAPSRDADGGALFKFVPANPAPEPMTAAAAAYLSQVGNKSDSPFAAGTLYALQVGGRGVNPASVAGEPVPPATATQGQIGQGNQYGEGRWTGPIAPGVPGTSATARTGAATAKATGYYRPEDLEGDSIAATDGTYRFCWTNTGVSSRKNWGEVLCGVDRPDAAAPTGMTPEVQVFSTGNSKMNQPDNIEFQPKTGVVYVIEDTPTVGGASKPGDVWACLRDGADNDTLSDGCVMVLSVVTSSAEPTGFKFEASGKRAYVNIQHSSDNPATPEDEGLYDEMLEIRGWEPHEARAVR